MTGTFFALAFLPALNPKLFAADLLLIENARAAADVRVLPAGRHGHGLGGRPGNGRIRSSPGMAGFEPAERS
jgi:hypothetical protein